MKSKLSSIFPGILLFAVALVIGLVVYRDYGMGWDEPLHRDLGLVTYKYVFHGDQSLKTYQDRVLGTGFEVPLILLEKSLKLNTLRDIFMMRHLVTHIFFLCSAFCGYLLALRLFKNQFTACLGFILIAFHPRIYAHSFFNSSDIPFLSACLIALLLFHIAFEQRKWGWFLLLGIVCGYATTIRAMGVFFLPCIGAFFLIDAIHTRVVKGNAGRVLSHGLLCVTGFGGMLYLSWPVLWEAPLQNFITIFHKLANIYYGGKVLFNGEFFPAEHLPTDYMFVWFSITVPELWLIAGTGGLIWIVYLLARQPAQYFLNTPERNFILYAACFAGPVAAMVLFHGANVDDWRHLYYIYPSFVMLALFLVNKLLAARSKLVVQGLCLLQVGATSWFMIGNHSFQQVYFNSFVPHKPEYLRNNFDLDYWGCSFKQGLEQLVAADKSDSIKINWSIPPLFNNILMLPDKDQKRIFVVDGRDKAHYLITNFRGNAKVEYPDLQPVHTISVQNSMIMCIYKLH